MCAQNLQGFVPAKRFRLKILIVKIQILFLGWITCQQILCATKISSAINICNMPFSKQRCPHQNLFFPRSELVLILQVIA